MANLLSASTLCETVEGAKRIGPEKKE
jgi:hypothetical protein